jgi:protein TonB
MSQTRSDRALPLAGSFLLHGGVLALGLLSFGKVHELSAGSVVPVTIVTNAPTTDLRAAVQADEAAPALTEEPVPAAPVESVAPTPAPVPTPPLPKPAPAVAPPTPKPVPTKPTKPAEKGLDLDALAASVAKVTKASGAKASSAARGPARAETALQARPAMGQGLSANAMAGLSAELQRRWNPNCEVEGGRDVHVRVTFMLGAGGQVVGQVDAGGQDKAPDSVTKAAAERAIRAVYQAAPFKNLPREFYGDRIVVNFNAREACT